MAVLFELNDNQRLYLQTIFNYFHTKGTWPTPRFLEGVFFKKNPELNVDEIVKSFPRDFVEVSPSSGSVYSGGPVLTVPAMCLCQDSEEDLKDFIQAVHFCMEKYLKFDEAPQITFDELSRELNLSPLSVSKAMQLLPFEPRILASASSDGRYGIAKEILRFQGVETIEQYLEKRDQLKKPSNETSISPTQPQEGTNEGLAIPKAMKPMVFEELIYELLEALDFSEITRPEGKEQGFDFQAVYPYKSPTGEIIQQIWIIEIRYYAKPRIGRADLEQLLGYMQASKADKALLITNTNLTSFAKEVVARTNLEARQKLEVWDGERLLALIAQFPTLQNQFGTLLSQFFHESTVLLEPKQISLTERLAKCQPGLKDAHLYEEICTDILTEILVPPLKTPRIQARTLNGLERRDALFSLRGAKQGWEEIRQEFEANFLLCEFKNYTDLFDKDEVNQTRNYLRETIGRMGIIFSRKGASDSAMRMRNSIYAQERKVILFFEDKQLVELLKMKEANRNPLDLIHDAIEDFLISYE